MNVEALRALEKAVEAGVFPDYLSARNLGLDEGFGGLPVIKTMYAAFSGSLDAAFALHDAVLPGWIASVDTDGFARVYWPGPVITVMETVRLDGSPARAWLLAIIRALIAQAEAKGVGE